MSSNPKSVTNVNVAQGPRTGNNPSMGKRGEFKAAKAEREPLAASIMKAIGGRGDKTRSYIDSGLESVSADTRAKFKK